MACERVKAWLSRERVPFSALDVEEDERAYDALVALGVRTVPLTVIDGVQVKGFDEPTLRAALERARAG